jgi:hypothetical protein
VSDDDFSVQTSRRLARAREETRGNRGEGRWHAATFFALCLASLGGGLGAREIHSELVEQGHELERQAVTLARLEERHDADHQVVLRLEREIEAWIESRR